MISDETVDAVVMTKLTMREGTLGKALWWTGGGSGGGILGLKKLTYIEPFAYSNTLVRDDSWLNKSLGLFLFLFKVCFALVSIASNFCRILVLLEKRNRKGLNSFY